MKFNPAAATTFSFVSYSFDEDESTAVFCYRVGERHEFRETYKFRDAKTRLSGDEKEALDRCLRYLFIVSGISYYKTTVASTIVIDPFTLTKEQARFFQSLYVNGLGEFSYLNKIDVATRVSFPSRASGHHATIPQLGLRRRTAIPVGGGKDSVVTIEALKRTGEPICLISLGNYEPIARVAKCSGLEHLVVTRSIDPLLFELNKNGAYNGHVPISAIIAFVMPVAAILYGFDSVALSNERSANLPNVVRDDGFEVNHQYSKSYDFEERVSDFFADNVLPGFNYFSFLRPLSELAISRLFSRTKIYDSVFTSCGSSFKSSKASENGKRRWCLRCHKCRSTFLLLAPFFDRQQLIEIFGSNLLDDPEQRDGFRLLIGDGGHKPFECVGSEKEYYAALGMLAKMPEWKNDDFLKYMTQSDFREDLSEKYFQEEMTISKNHSLTDKHLALLYEICGSQE